jgi:single-strand DNA-binding protein
MKVAAKAYLARKPDLVYTDKGTAIWKTAVAVQGRERGKDESLFVEVLAFGGLAEALAEADLKKGDLVQMEGRLQTETYEAKEGGKKTRLTLVLDGLAVVVRAKKPEGEAKEAEEAEEDFPPPESLPF